MNPPAAPPAAPPGKGGAWIRQHKGLAIAGGGAVLFLVLKSRSSSSGTTSGLGGLFGAPAATSTTSTGTVSGAYGYPSTSQLDQYNQLAGAISNLNDQVQAIQASNPAQAVSTLPPAGLQTETLVGGGYGPPSGATSVTAGGQTYNWVQTGAQALAAQQAGVPLAYQPSPGVFAPIPANSLTGPGGWFIGGKPTPLYIG